MAAGSNRKTGNKRILISGVNLIMKRFDHWFEETETNIESEYREKGFIKS
ncbi:MAG: hypothetical protein ACLSBH_22965 [Coprobacillus cateniformis]